MTRQKYKCIACGGDGTISHECFLCKGRGAFKEKRNRVDWIEIVIGIGIVILIGIVINVI